MQSNSKENYTEQSFSGADDGVAVTSDTVPGVAATTDSPTNDSFAQPALGKFRRAGDCKGLAEGYELAS
jgi:hypothetical protein